MNRELLLLDLIYLIEGRDSSLSQLSIKNELQ